MRQGPLTALRSRLARLQTLGGWRGLAFDAGLGLIAALGQAPLGWWPVALLGFGFGLWRISGAAPPRAAFLRGLFLGAGHFAFALSWIVQPFFVDPWRHGWLAPFVLPAMAFGLALFWGAAGWLSARLRAGPVGLAFALGLAELARAHLFTGFPWSMPGHVWADTPLAQTAALWGVHGMTLAMLLGLAVPMAFGRRGLLAPLALAAIAGGFSWYRLQLPEPGHSLGVVRLVQPDIAQSLKWDASEADRNFRGLMDLSRQSGADLVLWPETSVPYLIEEGEGAALAMAAAAAPSRLAAGIQRDEGDGRAWNSLAVFDAQGFITQSFDKMHLVPFGEYIPFGDQVHAWTGLSAFASRAGAGYTAGTERGLLDFGASLGRAVPVICYEAIFAEELDTERRADFMVQVTNDAWFGTLNGPWQHLAQVRLRAIEQGMAVMRVANTGVSAVIDARGRVAMDLDGRPAMLGLGRRGVIDAHVPGALGVTPYGRWGDLPVLIVLLAGFGIAAMTAARRLAA